MYDVFISFKNRAANGQPTRDMRIAAELYEKLRAQGLNVFFSDQTLTTAVFMEQIYDALAHSKILILVGTSVEYINSEWVKSEWSNYLGSINNRMNPNGQIITLLEGIYPTDLPIQLSNFQSFKSKEIDRLVEFVIVLLSGRKFQKAPEKRRSSGGRAFLRVMLVLLAAAVAFGALVYFSQKQDDETIKPVSGAMPEGIKYNISNGTITIEKYTGHESGLTIPSAVDGCYVTRIGSEAFNGCDFLSAIDLPDTIKEISDSAFSGCSGLTEISLPGELQSIQPYAFTDCSSLKEIIVPGSVREIGSGAFWDCSALEYVTIQNGVERIGDFAFWGCSELESVSVPASVTHIGTNAFYASSAQINAPYSPQYYNYTPTENEKWAA